MAARAVTAVTRALGRPHRRRAEQAIAALLLSLSVAGAHLTTALAAPGTPGVPGPPIPVFVENFENAVGISPVILTSFVGATGQTYTADPAWLQNCNGVIVTFSNPNTALAQSGCTGNTAAQNQIAFASVRQMAWALGSFEGVAPTTNHAVTAYTDGANPGPNKVQFATVQPIPLSFTGRFLSFSVNTAATNCNVQPNHAMYEFYLVNGATLLPTFTTPIDPCTSPTTITAPAIGANAAKSYNVGTFYSNKPVLFTGSSVGIQMVNAQGSGLGNDAAFDNVRLVDVTPQLDKAFSPPNASGVSTMTFTITNTSELEAKSGWSFTDALPAGLALASPTGAFTNCSAGTVTGAAGGTTISGAGSLNAGQAFCTITVNVV